MPLHGEFPSPLELDVLGFSGLGCGARVKTRYPILTLRGKRLYTFPAVPIALHAGRIRRAVPTVAATRAAALPRLTAISNKPSLPTSTTPRPGGASPKVRAARASRVRPAA